MRQAWRWTYNVLRTLAVTVIVAVILLYAGLYVLLSVPAMQNRIKAVAERQLSDYLKTNVTIGHLNIMPFDQVRLTDVNVPDQQGGDLFHIDKLGAGIDLKELIVNHKIVVSYGEIDGLTGHITRPDKNSPTNMQFLVDALKPKGNKPPTQFDLKLRQITVRNSAISYDVLNAPQTQGRFNANHLRIDGLRADVEMPVLKNDNYVALVKWLSFKEQSGLTVKRFTAQVAITQKQMRLAKIELELPGTDLRPNDFVVDYDSLKHMVTAIKARPIDLHLVNAKITPSDFGCFAPQLLKFQQPLWVTAHVNGTKKDLHINQLTVTTRNNRLRLDATGDLYALDQTARLRYHFSKLDVAATRGEIAVLTGNFVKLKPNVQRMLTDCGNIRVSGRLDGTLHSADFQGDVLSSLGNLTLNGKVNQSGNRLDFAGHVATRGFKLGTLLGRASQLGDIALNADVAGVAQGGRLNHGSLKGNVAYADFKGYRYQNVVADVTAAGNRYSGSLAMNDPGGRIEANGTVNLAGAASTVDAHLTASQVNLKRLRLSNGAENLFSFTADAAFVGNSLDNATGQVVVNNLTFVQKGKTYHLNTLNVQAYNKSQPQVIGIQSDFLNGTLTGNFDFATMIPTVKGMLSKTFPKLFGQYANYGTPHSKTAFQFHFEVEPNDAFNALVKLPVKLLYKATVSGQLDAPTQVLAVNIDAPYIQQGNNLIEGTSLAAAMDGNGESVRLNAQTLIPSKNGKIAVTVNSTGANDQIDTDLGWRYNRQHDYHGDIKVTTRLSRMANRKIAANFLLNPSQVVVNDTVWNVVRGQVNVANGVVQVDSVHAQRENQFIDIDGRVSRNADDELKLVLQDIDLDYVFETLNISNVNFGGRATGTFYASNLMSGMPMLRTPDLHVENIKYNNADMGNADIESHWDNSQKAVVMNAVLSQRNRLKSYIKGAIFPTVDSLYFDFRANKANVKFMKPFMEAFTSDVGGLVSGHAVLLGNFHTIDLYGDVYADSLRLKLDFSNVYYTCSDSVHMRPGHIEFDNVRLYDRDRHSATLSGWVNHDHFHNPSFNFTVRDARDFLCYDTDSRINPVWYGTVYGNGSAFISGEPGIVNVKVNMESAPRSKFTFVLSDSEEASEYNFITYRDRDALNAPVDTTPAVDTIPEVVKAFTRKVQQQQASLPTDYVIDLQGSITPDLQMTLVMDPVGGDKIKATGNGNLHMTYEGNDERLNMYGRYVLDKGSYNFTLQDIIIKDFTIEDGSSISFNGDPYKGVLDIKAYYALNANISDLDQSFSTDRDLNRTNVPVHAVLMAQGVMSSPEISFDLEFPTLTTEAVRKIKSVISTNDMMNRQIVYLLALNRFYTPDYMNGTNRGNEFTSVASSTLSSQLSNILGQLNENWSISPNIRTDKGDFSDTEFDLALSSQLLNNRLLFNGNFGYRDNTYNSRNSNFIGDFDIEYLLNRQGSLRLKAYNHFNDQNYYVRSAMTTQGVGIVFKHDFDNWRDFFRRRKPVTADTLPVAPTDSTKTEK